MSDLGDIFRRRSFPGNELVAKYADFCEEVGKVVTLQTYFHPELFPKNGNLRGLRRLTQDQRTKLLVDRIVMSWGGEPKIHEVEMLLKAGVDTEYVHPHAEGGTLLGVAARRGFADCVDALLRHGADAAAQYYGLTPFQQSAYAGQPGTMEVFLAHGADLSLRTAHGMTPLMLVVNGLGSADNKRRAIEFLFSRGVSIEDKDNEGKTAIDYFNRNHWYYSHHGVKDDWAEPLLKVHKEIEDRKRREEATRRLNKAIHNFTGGGGKIDPKAIQRYIDDGADIEHIDEFWQTTPLGILSSYNCVEPIKVLIAAGANVSPRDKKNGFTPMTHAGFNGYVEMINLLLDNGATVDETDNEGETALIAATTRGCRTEAVKLLIKRGAQVDIATKSGKTAFDYCEENKNAHGNYHRGSAWEVHTELEQILRAGSHRRFLEKLTGLDHTASDAELTAAFIRNGADIDLKDAHGMSPFLWAASRGDIDAMDELLRRGADLQATDNTGKNALMLAVYPEIHVEAARFLLDRGIFADLQDRQRRTALDWAKEVIGDTGGTTGGRPKAEAMKALNDAVLVAGYVRRAEIDLEDAQGCTPLLRAASRGDTDLMELLLDKGADLQVTDNTGKNALMLAVYPEIHLEAAKLLLNRGIFADLQDQQNRTALDWAREVVGDKDGKTNGKPRAEAVKAFQSAYEPVQKNQALAQYHSGLRGPVRAKSFRLKRPEP